MASAFNGYVYKASVMYKCKARNKVIQCHVYGKKKRDKGLLYQKYGRRLFMCTLTLSQNVQRSVHGNAHSASGKYS
jgi:hypothetical protein